MILHKVLCLLPGTVGKPFLAVLAALLSSARKKTTRQLVRNIFQMWLNFVCFGSTRITCLLSMRPWRRIRKCLLPRVERGVERKATKIKTYKWQQGNTSRKPWKWLPNGSDSLNLGGRGRIPLRMWDWGTACQMHSPGWQVD